MIPVAGLGTRFLPATKSMPKEMLPVVDRPVVQYAVDEAFEAGIEHIVFVTGRNKAVIEDYFDLHPELIGTLEQTGKKTQLEALESMLPVAGASFIRQQSPQGLGHAVWCAREVIGNEPFALLLPDMVSFGGRGCLAEIVDLYDAPAAMYRRRGCAPEHQQIRHRRPAPRSAAVSRSTAWSKSRRRPTRRRTSTSTAATSCSPRSSRCWAISSVAPATRSS